MSLLFWVSIFVISLAVLIKSADYFTESSERVGRMLKVPPFIIGVTIVSIGTSLPELATSVIAVIRNEGEIVAANAVGSNIANILLIVGISSIVARKMSIKRSLINLDLPLLACATAIAVFVLLDKEVNYIEGIVLLLTYTVYVFYTVSSQRREETLSHRQKSKEKNHLRQDRKTKADERRDNQDHKSKAEIEIILTLVASAVFIYLGANYTIESIVKISEKLNIEASLIAMSAAAIGTSLPELVVSAGAAIKKKYEISLGNVFGSNIFNVLVVIGIPSMIGKLNVDDVTFSIGIPFLIGATILYIFSGISRKIYNWEGMMYVIIYILFLIKIFGIA